MEIIWLGHAAFKVKTQGKIVYFDPYEIPKDEDKADIIICSHSHHDHFDKKSIKRIKKDTTMVFGPKSMQKELDTFDGEGLDFFEPHMIDDIEIKLVPAYNIKRKRDSGEPFHPKESKWAGTLLKSEGKTLYHSGDTEKIPMMRDLRSENVTVAMLPCGGTYTMDFKESTDAAVDINPEIVVPMHNWDKNIEDFKETLANKNRDIKVEVLKNKSLKL
jgi:L-ascorbate metabolism protein UlaG (beta-lactamase superfamily)